MNIAFMGTPYFAVPILRKLIESKREIKCVFTQPDKPAGRGRKISLSSVKQEALKHKLEILQPSDKMDIYLLLKEHEIDLVVIASYGMILTKDVTDHYLCLNVHPSLLPKYRGASPVQSAILNGEKETGVTIMVTQEKLDTGEILMQEKLSVSDGENAFDVSKKLADLGADLLIRFLNKINYFSKEEVIKNYGKKQDESQATYTKKVSKKDGLIDWSKSPKEVHNLVRAMYPWPGAYTFVEEKRVKIIKTKINKDGSLRLLTVQPEGRKEMSYDDYLRGHTPII